MKYKMGFYDEQKGNDNQYERQQKKIQFSFFRSETNLF